ncbi:carboxypeptidase M-like isoform X2 [Salvelinus fontinalis]|nr:carboxypeptidase M-like isoform X2 [Salvelinus fontinalis]XP_055761805.1 carboxypeptidase M-like isoform X2 [Salvelinus fontinalis]
MSLSGELDTEANSGWSTLSEDQSRCAVCEQVLTDPVSITCGHRFCRQCITRYWVQPAPSGHYGCPRCRKRFRTRPVLLQLAEHNDDARGSENSVKGQVLDTEGNPLQNALVEVEGRQNLCPFRTDRHGEYYRLLLPGNYTFTVTFPGHQVLTETMAVPYGPDSFSALVHNFQLQRSASTTPGPSHPTQSCTPPQVWRPLGGHSHSLGPSGVTILLGLQVLWNTMLL